MSKRYTEGIAGDGAAILDNGTPITITEILNRLNDHDKLVKESDSLPCVSDFLSIKEVAGKWGEKVKCMFFNYSDEWVKAEMTVNVSFLKDMEQGAIKDCH